MTALFGSFNVHKLLEAPLPTIQLQHAGDVHARLLKRRAEMFAEFPTRIPFVLEQMNERIEAALEKGLSYITLTHEEIDGIPDTEAEVFVAYLKDRGFVLARSSNVNDYRAYFYDVLKED